jgi:hypothetical protein
VAERIFDGAAAVAVELVGQGSADLTPRRHRALEAAVDVLQVDVEAERRPAQCLGGAGDSVGHLGHLVGQHQAGIADLQLGVTQPPIGHVHPVDLLGAERLLVELDRCRAPLHDNVRGDRVVTGRNCLHLRHGVLLGVMGRPTA